MRENFSTPATGERTSGDAFQRSPDQRDYYTERLENLTPAVSNSEMEFIRAWQDALPLSEWGLWLLSWARSLEAYGTPTNFVDGFRFTTDRFRELGMEWPSGIREGGNYELRRELMERQTPYHSLFNPSFYQLRTFQNCLLCENVLQSIDAKFSADMVKSNTILDLGACSVFANRYPSMPLHMLWLSKNHDDMSRRVFPITADIEGSHRTLVPREEGSTRGNVVSEEELCALFTFCRAVGLVAMRNHPLSGMSIPGHDHWHLMPQRLFPNQWFENIAGSGDDRVTRASGSPFDILVLREKRSDLLASLAATVLNNLELDDQVFSPTYIPTASGIVMIAALKKDSVGDRYSRIGSSVQGHEFPSEGELLETVRKDTPRRYETDWASFTPNTPIYFERAVTAESIFHSYTPIDYQRLKGWGTGEPVRHRLTPLARDLYDKLLPLQDKRGDTGHTDTVVHLSLSIAQILELDAEETEAVSVAAIAHDAGWHGTERINERWNELATKLHGSDKEAALQAKEEMYALRWGHQERAVEILRKELPNYPRLEEVCDVVGDHDTRTSVHKPIYRAFLDGDWLARVSKTACLSESMGNFDRSDPNKTFEILHKQIKPEDFTFPASYFVARLELANTMLAMRETFRWPGLPADFLKEYKRELLLLEKAA